MILTFPNYLSGTSIGIIGNFYLSSVDTNGVTDEYIFKVELLRGCPLQEHAVAFSIKEFQGIVDRIEVEEKFLFVARGKVEPFGHERESVVVIVILEGSCHRSRRRGFDEDLIRASIKSEKFVSVSPMVGIF